MEFTKAEKEFFAKRDKELEGLKKCADCLMPDQLSQKGCTFVRYEELTERVTTYEFRIYEKDGRKIVYNEVYVDMEGGMYYQQLYTEDGAMP